MENATETPPRRLKRQKVFAVLPTLLTLGNAVCGFGAITILARVGPTLDVVPLEDSPQTDFALQMVYAAQLIFLAMLFDALDGSAARLTNQTTEFGAMLDSLCDAVSFGVAPAFMMLKLTHPDHRLMDTLVKVPFNYPVDLLWPIAALFLMCAILRLARFNVETDEDDAHDGFSGLPSPAAAGVIAGFPIGVMWLKRKMIDNADARWIQTLGDTLLPALAILLPVITLATAVLMVSRIRYPHVFNQLLKGDRGRMQLLQLVFTLALVSVVKGMAVPVIFCWFAFSAPLKAVWLRYVLPTLRRNSHQGSVHAG